MIALTCQCGPVLSMPRSSPVPTPVRIALGSGPTWEIALDIMLMVAATYGMARLAARIYAAAIMRGGAWLTWRAALWLEIVGPGGQARKAS